MVLSEVCDVYDFVVVFDDFGWFVGCLFVIGVYCCVCVVVGYF